jgi:hypothetical protein
VPGAGGQSRLRVIGGVEAGTNGAPAAPHQVALLANRPGLAPYDAQFCGGVVVSPRVVLTAAHCVEDRVRGSALAVSSPEVLAGSHRLADDGQPQEGTQVAVEGVAIHPAYQPSTGSADVAALMLPAPGLALGPAIAAVAPLDDTAAPGSPVRVAGWGATTTGLAPPSVRFPQALQTAALEALADTAPNCGPAFVTRFGPAAYDPLTMVCAAAPGRDACAGDSGGGLVTDAPAPALAGLVSFGEGCADPDYAGVYADVAGAALRPFAVAPPAVPAAMAAPVVAGPLEEGQTLTCAGDTWNEPVSRRVQFQRLAGGRWRPLEAVSSDSVYVVGAADVAGPVRCVVEATEPGGRRWAFAASAPVGGEVSPPAETPDPGPAAPPPPPPPPAEPPPAPATSPAPAAVPAPLALDDRRAPRAFAVRSSCERTRCDAAFDVVDRIPSAGVGRLEVIARPTWARPCRRIYRCGVRRLRVGVSRLGGRRFTVRVRTPHEARVRLVVQALDRAGNRQRVPVVATVRFRGL